jgi:hypothetical protein
MKLAYLVSMVLLTGCVPLQVLAPEIGGMGPLKVIAEPPTVSASGDLFQVRVRLKNVSRSAQTVSVWSCSRYENWKTDNERVNVPCRRCWSNDTTLITLQPGEINEQTIELMAVSTRAEETFRVGFKSAEVGDASVDSKKVYWSDPVVVRLMPTP